MATTTDQPSLSQVVGQWGRIGCLGFGGPPVHIRMFRELCVERNRWIDAAEFEDAIAACNLLPGPSSTQLSIYTAWRVRGTAGGLCGGVAFILPGLVLILALAALFLGDPPAWVLGLGAGAGAAVAAVALQAGGMMLPSSWARTPSKPRWLIYLALGGIAAAVLGAWVVVVLLGCGLAELVLRRGGRTARHGLLPATLLLPGDGLRTSGLINPGLWAGGVGGSAMLPLTWTAFKVGMLSYGGGFVIVPLMQDDAIGHGWMSATQFLNGVALGQVTPGPVVQTIGVVGFAVAGVAGGLLAAVVAFAPSFLLVLGGGAHFDRLRGSGRARSFLDGAGPAALGAILGSAVPLALAITEPWQWGVLAGSAVVLLVLRRGVVLTLALAGAAGAVVALVGG